MEPNIDNEEQFRVPRKKAKLNEGSEQNDGWIVVKKKPAELSISICDFSKVNRYYSHKSLQNYIRYILVQTTPNPMWLSIKRQSLIKRIIYIDIEIENNLFMKMIQAKELAFLGGIANQSNIAYFKTSNKIFRDDIWDCFLCYDNNENIQEIASNKAIQQPLQFTQDLYEKYLKYILTPQQLKTHLYPDKSLPLYEDFYEPALTQKPSKQLKNCVLIIDCEMVSSAQGFQLARATIVNALGQVLLDQLFKPNVQIISYNTEYSGITQQILDPVTNTLENKLHPFLTELLCENTILIGHSLENDLRAMKLVHKKVIDSSVVYMRKNGTKFKLKSLAEKILSRKIQWGSHDSLEDCLATLHIIRAKIQNDQNIKPKQYDLIRQLNAEKKKAAIIDYAIDYQMKNHSSNHFQKIERYTQPLQIFRIAKKYLRSDVDTPELLLTRIQKPSRIDWEDYYLDFDEQFKDFHAHLPKMSAIFLNFQVNPQIQLLNAGETLKTISSTRTPCIILAV